MDSTKNNILLTGFSGTGKSTIGNEVAKRLGFDFVDTDQAVTQLAGRSVADIFASEGEEAFRMMESQVLEKACSERGLVIATGGGAFHANANQQLMLSAGIVICLEARPETIEERLVRVPDLDDSGKSEVRPLLQSDDPLGSIRALKGIRQASYAMAHWTIHTDQLTVSGVVEEVIRVANSRDVNTNKGRSGVKNGLAPIEPAAVVYSSVGPCNLYVGSGLLDMLGTFCKCQGLEGTAYLISDENVYRHYGQQVIDSLSAQGLFSKVLRVPPGEQTKGMDSLYKCYSWLAENRAERKDFIISLGGGVVGDLAGFVAATFNRGMSLVQIPTSLIGMVDSAIGGKTAVNLDEGKNLVGSFHQPKFVLADLDCLRTLPVRERISGWAESIKHGLILDRPLFEIFEDQAESILALEPTLIEKVISASMIVKATVVTRDEKETRGVRTLLNYGHTVGHALEKVMGYGVMLHGEAVAIGMGVAVRLSERIGLIDSDIVDRQDSLLERYGLPTRTTGVDLGTVWKAMEVDKKNQSGDLHWVLLEDLGRATVRSGVDVGMVGEVLEEMSS